MRNKLKLSFIILSSIAICFVFIFAIFVASLQLSHMHYGTDKSHEYEISKRRLPYPFKAGLTICSDIDGTSSLFEFLTIQEFLNTKNITQMGLGLGLEIGNSFFPITAPGQFAFISDNTNDRIVITDLIKLGYIDVIHSFNEAKNRSQIRHITELLENNNCKIDVWVNHARALSDLGPQEWCLGDNLNSNHYHTDFSIDSLGYQFVWIGEVSSIVGQGRPLKLGSFFASLNIEHFPQSLYNNVFKEICKYFLSFVSTKYANRKHNDLIYPLRLDDGQYVFGFVRSNVSFGGIKGGATSDRLADILTPNILKGLIDSRGYMIVYTHFGQNSGYPYISERTQNALRLLESDYRKGNIYVTTTDRMLRYYANNKYLRWHSRIDENKKNIYIESVSDPVRGSFTPTIEDLRGITFYTDDPENTDIFIKNERINDILKNNIDHENRKSVMIPLKPLPKIDAKMIEYKSKGYF